MCINQYYYDHLYNLYTVEERKKNKKQKVNEKTKKADQSANQKSALV